MIKKVMVLLTAVVLMIATSSSANSAQERNNGQVTPKHARAAYLGDESTPNGIVYRSFLSSLTYFSTLSREDAVHRIVDTFKLAHDETGDALANSLYDYFEAAYYELDSEIHAMQVRTMCLPASKSWTQEQVYRALHKSDDNVEKISDKYFRRAHEELTDEEFEKLFNHISEMKKHFGYVKADYASKYASLPVDVRDDLVQICAKLGVSE